MIARVAGALVVLAMLGAAATGAAGAQDLPPLVGDWAGNLDTGGAGTLRIVFHVTQGSDGRLGATMDSPDQGAYGIAAGPVTRDGRDVRIEVGAVGGHYEGTFSEDGGRIDGTWHQGGASLPLALAPTTESAPKRPQEPRPPYPYETREVRFESVKDGVTLAGTLTVPPGDGPFPAVVLVSGSGPQDRDETVFGHRPFLVLADALTRRGIVVLRYDDRGVGESTGNIATAVTADFADDAEGAVRYLAPLPEVAAGEIGIIGHSEGAVVAPIVANRDEDVGFVVLLASTGVTGEELLVMQLIAINRAMGVDEAITAQRSELQRSLLGLVSETPDDSVVARRAREILAAAGVTGAGADAQVRALLTPWMRYFLAYDPLPALRALKVPVLALWGGKDTQVPPEGNLEPVRAALEESESPDVTVRVLPGLNHLFQTADTGAPTEYVSIEETMAPVALETIGDWIRARTE